MSIPNTQVIPSKAYDAYYKLTDPVLQIKSYVEDIVRSSVPKMELDQAFEAKVCRLHVNWASSPSSVDRWIDLIDSRAQFHHPPRPQEELAHTIRDALQHTMSGYGYSIIQALVVDIRVDDKVKHVRMREARLSFCIESTVWWCGALILPLSFLRF